MFSHSNKILFFMIMILSTLLILSSNNWFSIWIGLEMNLMSFIPLIFKRKNVILTESCIMYFMMQSIGSMMMLFSVLGGMNKNMENSILLISMLIKLGMPPFHYWFVQMMSKINWISCLLLMTWQKIGPLMILSMLSYNSMLMMFGSLISVLGGINQTDLRKILSFSSINHLSWMLSCMKNSNTWIIYYMFYVLITMMLVLYLSYNEIYYINQLNKLMFFMEKLLFITLMLSMGGMPPFIGFLPKLLALNQMILVNDIFLAFIMIMMSMINMFYYIRVMSGMLFLYSAKSKWTLLKSKSFGFIILSINMILPIMLFLIN